MIASNLSSVVDSPVMAETETAELPIAAGQRPSIIAATRAPRRTLPVRAARFASQMGQWLVTAFVLTSFAPVIVSMHAAKWLHEYSTPQPPAN